MTAINVQMANVYTITLGQQPIGMARADNPHDAIDFVRRLWGEAIDVTELRLRRPTPTEAQIFEKQFGTVKKDGVLGFVF
jgi:hypothetical protein